MTEYKSKKATVSKEPYQLYMAFVDMRNFIQFLPEDKKEGVSADYDGIKIEPHNITDWDEFKVNKFVQGTNYNIKFKKGEDKGIFVDGKRINGNIVKSNNEKCDVLVIY